MDNSTEIPCLPEHDFDLSPMSAVYTKQWTSRTQSNGLSNNTFNEEYAGTPASSSTYDLASDGSKFETTAKPASFPQFTHLPIELRQMIWEMTWPEPKVVNLAFVNLDFHETPRHDTTLVLKPLGTIHNLALRDDLRFHDWSFGLNLERSSDDWEPGNSWEEDVKDPITLHVCQESRKFTLKHYCVISHPELSRQSFYVNGQRDAIWINEDVMGSSRVPNKPHIDFRYTLEQYGAQLSSFHTALVDMPDWDEQGPSVISRHWYRSFSAITKVMLIVDAGYFEEDVKSRCALKELQNEHEEIIAGKRWKVEYLCVDGASADVRKSFDWQLGRAV